MTIMNPSMTTVTAITTPGYPADLAREAVDIARLIARAKIAEPLKAIRCGCLEWVRNNETKQFCIWHIEHVLTTAFGLRRGGLPVAHRTEVAAEDRGLIVEAEHFNERDIRRMRWNLLACSNPEDVESLRFLRWVQGARWAFFLSGLGAIYCRAREEAQKGGRLS